jgi:hypothetical protein
MKCTSRFQAFTSKYLFKSKSHYLLNYLTLKIEDEEIALNFTAHKLQSYDELLNPYVILAGLLLLWRIGTMIV